MDWYDPRAPFSPVDITSKEFSEAPRDAYDTIRKVGPIVWQPQARGFLLTTYADSAAVLRDPRFYSADLSEIWRRVQDKLGRDYGEAIELFAAMPFVLEGQQHARFRRALATAIAPFAGGSPEIGWCVEQRIKTVLRDGGFDIARDYAAHLLFDIMCDMLRVPTDERSELKTISTMSWALELTIPLSWRDAAAAEIRRARTYLVRHVSQPAVQSASPFVASVYAAFPEGEPQRDLMVATLITVMLVMGNDALGACITFAVTDLKDLDAERGEQVAQLDWESISDDAIRHAAPVDLLTRIARGDTELAGCSLREGDRLVISPLCANHDPAEFGPETSRITVKPGKGTGLSFGAGSHLCVGNRFSRTVIRAGFSGLARLPSFRLNGPMKRGPGNIVRTIESLPATIH